MIATAARPPTDAAPDWTISQAWTRYSPGEHREECVDAVTLHAMQRLAVHEPTRQLQPRQEAEREHRHDRVFKQVRDREHDGERP